MCVLRYAGWGVRSRYGISELWGYVDCGSGNEDWGVYQRGFCEV